MFTRFIFLLTQYRRYVSHNPEIQFYLVAHKGNFMKNADH